MKPELCLQNLTINWFLVYRSLFSSIDKNIIDYDPYIEISTSSRILKNGKHASLDEKKKDLN